MSFSVSSSSETTTSSSSSSYDQSNEEEEEEGRVQTSIEKDPLDHGPFLDRLGNNWKSSMSHLHLGWPSVSSSTATMEDENKKKRGEPVNDTGKEAQLSPEMPTASSFASTEKDVETHQAGSWNLLGSWGTFSWTGKRDKDSDVSATGIPSQDGDAATMGVANSSSWYEGLLVGSLSSWEAVFRDQTPLQMPHEPLWLGGMSVVLLLVAVLLWKRCFGSSTSTKTSSKRGPPTLDLAAAPYPNRSRVPSADTLGGLLSNSLPRGDGKKPNNNNNNNKSATDLFPVLMGARVGTLVYSTHTPPSTWSEASKKLLPKDTKTRSQKQLVLDIPRRTVTTLGVNKNDRRVQTISMDDLSIHVKVPVEGAVLELYTKQDPKQEWMEHTFPAALDAAQFQYDLLGCQVLGASIQHMYNALEVVHKGSLAHDGKECLLHDSESDERPKLGSVAWDDAMRCFAGVSTVRTELERQLKSSVLSLVAEVEESSSDEPAVAPEYADKRNLLGPVDFFRLFMPLLPQTSFPHEESNPQRMEHLLRARKVVAKAAVLVRSYVEARIVVNQGWKVTPEELPDGYLSRRLAYDTNSDNVEHDNGASNEYYEATVSRDIKCLVHSRRHLKTPGASSPSAYQAYSLVGSHIFRLPPEGQDHPLKYSEDPVEALPSLRRLVEAHPDLHFFACAFFPEGICVAIVHFFVRSLPKGIDVKFDKSMDRFVNGAAELRDRKLELFMQLGPGSKLSPLVWAALKAVSLVLSWTRKGETEIPLESRADRTAFPGMTLSNYTETRHFGGSLRTDTSLPTNYVSATSHVDVSQMKNMAMRSLYQRLEEAALPASVVDFTFLLEGHQADELPERSLASVRLVHVDPVEVALPTFYSAVTRIEASNQMVSFLPEMVQEPVSSDVRSSNELSAFGGVPGLSRRLVGLGNKNHIGEKTEDEESFTDGVDALVDILRGVEVPVRYDQPTPTTRKVPVLELMTRNDLERYFVAAECRLKDAAVRVVSSAAWRGRVFPINVHECRIELQSGQFFQQGYDLMGHPIFYFQNLCVGPWRKDEKALISAVLHRLEMGLRREKSTAKCTVIINMGKPIRKKKKAKKKTTDDDTATNGVESEATTTIAVDDAETHTRSSATTEATTTSTLNPFRKGSNPRINPSETYRAHTNNEVVTMLVQILLENYPERLHKALIVPGDMFTAVGGSLTIRSFVSSQRTRSKIIILGRASELKQHVHKSELSAIVGGQAVVPRKAFECLS